MDAAEAVLDRLRPDWRACCAIQTGSLDAWHHITAAPYICKRLPSAILQAADVVVIYVGLAVPRRIGRKRDVRPLASRRRRRVTREWRRQSAESMAQRASPAWTTTTGRLRCTA